MAEGDLGEALRRLMERGWRGRDPTRPDLAGLADLRERLRRRRDALQERYNVADVLADVRAELEEIVAEERAGIERRLDEAADARRRRRRRRPTRRSERCSATRPPAGSTSSRRCRATSAAGSGRSRSTTSWSRPPATGSRR